MSDADEGLEPETDSNLTTTQWIAIVPLVGAGSLSILYYYGALSVTRFEKEFGLTGLFERDFYSVTIGGISPFVLTFTAIFIAFLVENKLSRKTEKKKNSLANRIRAFLIGFIGAALVSGVGGTIDGLVRAEVAKRNANECVECNRYVLSDSAVLGRPIAGDNDRIALLMEDGNIQLLHWDEIIEVELHIEASEHGDEAAEDESSSQQPSPEQKQGRRDPSLIQSAQQAQL